MRKFLSAIVLSAVFCASWSVASADAGSIIYKNNAMTASHVTPAGTHVSIVPPKGAVLSSTFAGFELPNNGKIQIAESSGASYKDTEGTLTPEGVESLNIKFRDKSPVNLNGSPATLVSGLSVSEPEVGVLLLVLGSDKMTVNIYGFYSDGDKAAEAAVKNSLLSCIFTQAGVKNSSGDYSLSASGTSLKFADEVSATRYFTVGGVPQSEAGSVLYTSTTADDVVPKEARNAYAVSAIGRFLSAYPEHKVVSTKPVNYGGLAGLETVAEFDGATRKSRTASGASVTRAIKGKGYQALLFDENEGKVYIFSGIALLDADSLIPQFIKITSTFAINKR
jgi:hypothetical protein